MDADFDHAPHDLWVFAYGSLIWRPGFAHEERLPARLIVAHRALCVYSFVHRGTPEHPGLVLGLDHGGMCRGIAYRIGDVLDTLLTLAKRKIDVVTDATRLRASDNPVLIGDPSRMSSEIGWQPAIPIEDSLRDLLEYWRRALAGARA